MVDFINTDKAKGIIDKYLTKGTFTTPPDINPIYDLREPGQEYPPLNPPVPTTPDIPDDPCPMGYQLIDGVCQPIDQFGGNLANEIRDDDDDFEERPYMSIEDMEGATDEELLEYLKDGRLTNSGMLGFLPSKGNLVTLKKSKFMPPLFKLAFGGQDKMREEFMLNELMKRGFFTGNFDDQQNPIFDIGTKNVNTNVGGIESMLPANNPGDPVTDVYGDTYQQVVNDNGNTGYTFTSGNPQDSVGQETQSGVIYGTGRGGGNSGGTGVIVNTSGSGNPFTGSFNPITNKEDDYDDESSGI